MSTLEKDRKLQILQLTKYWLFNFELGVSDSDVDEILKMLEDIENYEECEAIKRAQEIYKLKIIHERNEKQDKN